MLNFKLNKMLIHKLNRCFSSIAENLSVFKNLLLWMQQYQARKSTSTQIQVNVFGVDKKTYCEEPSQIHQQVLHWRFLRSCHLALPVNIGPVDKTIKKLSLIFDIKFNTKIKFIYWSWWIILRANYRKQVRLGLYGFHKTFCIFKYHRKQQWKWIFFQAIFH